MAVLIHRYALFILKNILGWVFILGSFVLGPAIPGPGGIPLFLLGFALVTFPGKRKLTARVLRGRQLGKVSWRYRAIATALSIIIAAVLVLFVWDIRTVQGWLVRGGWDSQTARIIALVELSATFILITMFAPSATDIVLRMMPKIRRKVRPKLRRVGIHLLPPRWHRHPHPHVDGLAERVRKMEEEIVQFSHEWKIGAQKAWSRSKPWIIKLVGVALVSIILYRLIKPIVEHWSDIQPHLANIRWELFALACIMFSANQFFCRVTSWRGVLHGLGWRFPQAPAARIWATSELVRYVPGVVWQVVGRVLLTKPYGLPATTCSISQILEITVYLLANVTVAVGMLSLAGGRISEEARPVLRAAAILLPILLGFLHPSIFYPVVNWVLRRIGKPVIETQLTGRRLLALLLLAIVGQLWLGLALWAGTHSILQIALKDAWLLSGAYCLAWTAGFCLASVAPSGIGVREFVLRSTLYMVLPMTLSQSLDQKATLALFAAVALLLRLWATIGELLFAGFAYVWDWRGARGRVPAKAEPVSSV